MAELKDDIKFFQVMPKNQENYRAIKIDNLWFIDSLQFMQASLDSLVKQEVSVTNVDDLKIINQAKLRKVQFCCLDFIKSLNVQLLN